MNIKHKIYSIQQLDEMLSPSFPTQKLLQNQQWNITEKEEGNVTIAEMGYRISDDLFLDLTVEIVVNKGFHPETIVKVLDWNIR